MDAVCAVEQQVPGLNRREDIAFLPGNRPGWLALLDGRPASYAFGAQPLPPEVADRPPTIGPIAAVDDPHMPLQSRLSIDHLLGLKARIDPFYIAALPTTKAMRLDRYSRTAPGFIL